MSERVPPPFEPHAAFESRGGRIGVRVSSSRVIHYVVEGYFDPPMAEFMLTQVEAMPAFQSGGIDAFHDWSRIRAYQTVTRLRLTRWMLQNRTRFRSVHILVQSPLVKMGVNIANAFIDDWLLLHETPATFAAALERASESRSE